MCEINVVDIALKLNEKRLDSPFAGMVKNVRGAIRVGNMEFGVDLLNMRCLMNLDVHLLSQCLSRKI